MKKVIVVGGGIAGLTAAVYLSEKGIEVTLLEASPKLGGRTYSLYNEKINDAYDNGQHILMGCYDETIRLLKKIDSYDKIQTQPSLEINFIMRDGSSYKLKSFSKGYPLNLLVAILNFKLLKFSERLRIVDFFLDLMCCYEEDLTNVTVSEWLRSKKQSENAVKSFWEVLIVGALNAKAEHTSASVFAGILKRIFLEGNFAATILIPKTNLSELFCLPSGEYIKSRNGSIHLSQKVISLATDGDFISGLETAKNEYGGFDALVFAIPSHALDKIKFKNSESSLPDMKLNYSPIVNVHLWLDQNPFTDSFYGLIGSDVHWLFNHGSYISLTSSAAEHLIALESNEIVGHFCSELENYFHILLKESVTDSIVIKEKRATFVPDIASNDIRKNFYSPFKNLFFAGDWTSTGLPSTIESAALSGRLVAEQLISFLSK